ncbi:PTS sugar transporter subunit IIA [Luteimonas sp. RD2P54]|uniref:PTS sugar transporter subunit IIA n=1 Tax=Luteimonas endophytica TaxID=3042023 RepID=A0ABT6JAZ4_9GAMM|nr:PTS sugar transporter subunit IIA [Luteimonas endophytica]MDH5823997.1 PTS sugar transporter subunit IIA [Luteimonas endophytica]
MPCTDLLAADRIAVLSGPASRAAVLDAVARLLGADPFDAGRVAAMLREREAQCSTGIGHGVAIPHARGGDAPVAAFLRLSQPVDFAACDGEPVDLVFAMRVPGDRPQDHLLILADLADCFADAAFRERLRAAADAEALRALLLGGARRRAA